jgi:hypothetical protein
MEQVAACHHDRVGGVCSSGSPFCRRGGRSQDVHLPAEGMQVTRLHYLNLLQHNSKLARHGLLDCPSLGIGICSVRVQIV